MEVREKKGCRHDVVGKESVNFRMDRRSWIGILEKEMTGNLTGNGTHEI